MLFHNSNIVTLFMKKTNYGRFIIMVILSLGNLIIIFSGGCIREDMPIKCIADYLVENIDADKIAHFNQLDGIEIWREWEDMTAPIAEDRYMLENCKIQEYISHYNLSLDDLRGQMFFVYSTHHYLKNGYVDQKAVIMEIDGLLSSK
jgi:hypothetical protein